MYERKYAFIEIDSLDSYKKNYSVTKTIYECPCTCTSMCICV